MEHKPTEHLGTLYYPMEEILGCEGCHFFEIATCGPKNATIPCVGGAEVVNRRYADSVIWLTREELAEMTLKRMVK